MESIDEKGQRRKISHNSPFKNCKSLLQIWRRYFFYLKHIITHQGLSLDLSESSNFNKTVPWKGHSHCILDFAVGGNKF